MARIAEHFANTLGVDWLEARVARSVDQRVQASRVTVEDGVNINCREATVLNEELLGWPDLFVVIGQGSTDVPVMPPGVRQKNWPLTDFFKPNNTDAKHQINYLPAESELKNRVKSMINGMRMLSKSD